MDRSIVVIGGGILGLAAADRILQERPGTRLTVLEKEADVGRHQTGHNSGVIHAGVYYAPGSLKARLCKEGVAATIAFCEANDVPYAQCGKLIVATDEGELGRMAGLEERVKANGLAYRRVGPEELRELEPHVAGIAALLIEASGITDYGQICRRLADRIEGAGGQVRLGARARRIVEHAGEVVVETDAGAVRGDLLLACAGLQADRIARMAGIETDFRVVPFRGEYYRVSQRLGQLATRLIYPVPDPALPFLGIHLTRMIGGYFTVGPNAVLSFSRENYARNSPNLRDLRDMLAFPGFWKLMARQMGAGLHEAKGSLLKRIYLDRCRKYCPSLTLDDLEPMEPGIRAQNVSHQGALIDDFLFKESARTLHVCNAPSPAATSAFPIARTIVDKALAKLG